MSGGKTLEGDSLSQQAAGVRRDSGLSARE